MKRRPSQKRTLPLLAVLLLGSAIVRLPGSEMFAFAQSDTTPQEQGSASTTADQTRSLYDALKLREAALELKEQEMTERERALEVVTTEINQKLQELRSAEVALRDTIALAETASESDLQQLTAVYENMKPKEAAEIFEQMAPEFSAGFLGLMRPEAAAPILTELSPEKAYSISVILAGRNVSTPSR